MNYKFPSCLRIRQRREFEFAFRHKSLNNKWFSIYIVNRNQEFARLGMVVSKRTMAKSISRNFAKRLIRETFRQNSFRLPAFDFVVRTRRSLSKDTSNEARSALLELMLSAKTS